MKYIFFSIVSATLIAGSFSCNKHYDKVMKDDPVGTTKAYIKIVHASPNFRTIHNQPDTFNVYVNNARITSGILTYNAMFPFGVNTTTNSFTTTYAAVDPGTTSIRLSLPGKNAVTTPDSLTIFTIDKTLQGGKFYTFMITDSLKMTRDSSKIFVEDQFKEINVLQGYINLRFINAAMNDTAGRTVNLSSYARNAIMYSNVKPGTVSGFGQFSWNLGVSDTLYVRRFIPGSTRDTGLILARVFLNSTLIGGGTTLQRSVTVYYKGDATTAAGTKGRSIGAYIND